MEWGVLSAQTHTECFPIKVAPHETVEQHREEREMKLKLCVPLTDLEKM